MKHSVTFPQTDQGPDDSGLPLVLAGPILRRATPTRLVLWLAGSSRLGLRLRLTEPRPTEDPDTAPEPKGPLFDRVLGAGEVTTVPVGTHAFLYLIDLTLDAPLPTDRLIGYDLGLTRLAGPGGKSSVGASPCWIRDWAPHLCPEGAEQPGFVLKSRLDRILHGSCRRPHHPAADGLVRVDREVQASRDTLSGRPALLMLTGDQIYADDVAGPMLRAIHGLIERLGLFHESLPEADVDNSEELLTHPETYYQRQQLLPDIRTNEPLVKRFFGGARKPVFTTSSAHNHLISLAEVIGMYLLVWSPVCWRLVQTEPPALPEKEAGWYAREQACIDRFVAGLPLAARALAQVPTYMIFDDHDVTDDWNLSALWEATTYGHPFSRRIVGNALIGYLLCQGWGNNPDAFRDLLPRVMHLLESAGPGCGLASGAQDAVIDALFQFPQWHYFIPPVTDTRAPLMVVLDTRTRRWRSALARGKPSGLMDWEALTGFQQAILDREAVVVVSPTPIFGVKLIEVIQRVFTFFGQPLMVDAENWMAHRGTASVLLNIFAHSRTPDTFVILSGDVHYSFAYDVRLRHKPGGPRIWQITSSGIKNEFPHRLLEWLDRLNRWLYAPWSPLNWFTQRRRMWINPRLPLGREAGERLWNHAGIGLVELDEAGVPVAIRQLNADQGETCFRAAGHD